MYSALCTGAYHKHYRIRSNSAIVCKDRARCLLIDFDNACPTASHIERTDSPETITSEPSLATSGITAISQELATRTVSVTFHVGHSRWLTEEM